MKKFLYTYVLKNWYPILIILVGILIYAGVFGLEHVFWFPGSWALLLIIPGLIYLKMEGMTPLPMVAIAYGVFLLLAASDYMSNPEMGGGLIESKWTPWLLMLVGVGCIIENMGRKYTIIKK
ncbi:MAG: hypothetical protein IJV50_05755 [Lachnospiraceae bacterium]|nr:hypothetical protein [Lachnospiraceae bacterium]